MSDNALLDEAFNLFGRLVARSDPSRFEAWTDLGLTLTQLRVLFLLRSGDGLNARTLAERLAVTPSTVTRLIDRLVHSGLVRREIGEEDRRLVRHHLTNTGFTTIEAMELAFRGRMNRVFARLTSDQLERLVASLRDLFAASDIVEAEEAMTVGV